MDTYVCPDMLLNDYILFVITESESSLQMTWSWFFIRKRVVWYKSPDSSGWTKSWLSHIFSTESLTSRLIEFGCIKLKWIQSSAFSDCTISIFIEKPTEHTGEIASPIKEQLWDERLEETNKRKGWATQVKLLPSDPHKQMKKKQNNLIPFLFKQSTIFLWQNEITCHVRQWLQHQSSQSSEPDWWCLPTETSNRRCYREHCTKS